MKSVTLTGKDVLFKSSHGPKEPRHLNTAEALSLLDKFYQEAKEKIKTPKEEEGPTG